MGATWEFVVVDGEPKLLEVSGKEKQLQAEHEIMDFSHILILSFLFLI
jgi:hypothetical protein